MVEDAAAEEGTELALDEARHGSLPRLRAREERRELGLHDAVEDALLGPAAGVLAVVAVPPGAMAMGGRRCGRAQAGGALTFVPGVIRSEGARRGEDP